LIDAEDQNGLNEDWHIHCLGQECFPVTETLAQAYARQGFK